MRIGYFVTAVLFTFWIVELLDPVTGFGGEYLFTMTMTGGLSLLLHHIEAERRVAFALTNSIGRTFYELVQHTHLPRPVLWFSLLDQHSESVIKTVPQRSDPQCIGTLEGECIRYALTPQGRQQAYKFEKVRSQKRAQYLKLVSKLPRNMQIAFMLGLTPIR